MSSGYAQIRKAFRITGQDGGIQKPEVIYACDGKTENSVMAVKNSDLNIVFVAFAHWCRIPLCNLFEVRSCWAVFAFATAFNESCTKLGSCYPHRRVLDPIPRTSG